MNWRSALKKQSNTVEHDGGQKIRRVIDPLLRKYAGDLSCRLAKMSPTAKRYFLLLFCLVWTTGLLAILFQAIYRQDASLSITPLSIPRHVTTDRAHHFFGPEAQKVRENKYPDNSQANQPALTDSLAFIKKDYSP